MKSISLYIDNGTWLTKVHPFTKLLYILAAVSIPLISGRLWLFGAMILLSILLLLFNGILKNAFPLIVFSFTIILMIFIVQGVFNQKNVTPLWTIGPVTFYVEGTLYALKIGLNILNMLLSFAVLVLSTKPSELVQELEMRGFSPKFGYIINSVFQIIPQMMGTMSTITDAQRSRGMETEGSLITRAGAFLPLISPVVVQSLTNTRERAIALEIRGFDKKTPKTFLTSRKVHKGDGVINAVLILMILAAIVLRVTIWR